MFKSTRPAQLSDTLAQATLIVAPLLAFDVLPLPGIFSLAMVLPLIVLVAYFVRTPGNRMPSWESLLLALLTISVVWGDEPNYTVVALRTYLPVVLAALFAGCLLSGEVVLRCLRWSFALIIGFSVVFLVIHPSTALTTPVTAQFAKNTFGSLLGITVLLILPFKRLLDLGIVAGLVVLIAVNRCATAWVMVPIFAIASYASSGIIRRCSPRVAAPFLAVTLLAAGSAAATLALADGDSALGVIGKDPTLTDRTAIWSACWEEIQRAPILGHGGFTFLNTASYSPVTKFVWAQFNGYRPPHPHNGFLDLIGQLGVVGVAVFAVMIWQGARRGIRRALRGDDDARTAVLILGFILAFGLTEPTYLGPMLVVTFMCLSVADPRPGRDTRASNGPSSSTSTSVTAGSEPPGIRAAAVPR